MMTGGGLDVKLGIEMGDGCHLDEDNFDMIRGMVKDLEEMDAAWRGGLPAQPSSTEQILYMLILMSVSSDIFLFHRERNSSLPDLPDDQVELIVNDLRQKGSVFGATLIGDNLGTTSCGDEDEYANDITNQIFSSWSHAHELLIKIIEEVRSSISLEEHNIQEKLEEVHGGHEVDAKKLKEFKDSEETREQILMDILCGLAVRRCQRSYAPPKAMEINFYREIRKWATSTVSFTKAKDSWLGTREFWRAFRQLNNSSSTSSSSSSRMGEVECMYCSAGQRDHTCHIPCMRERNKSISWIAEIFKFGFVAPNGHQIAAVFDELPEFRWLINGWRERFPADMTARDVVGCTHNDCAKDEADEKGKRDQVRQEDLDVDSVVSCPAAGNAMLVATKTRAQYLNDIMLAVLSMRGSSSSPLSSWLCYLEVRLYTRILEHVKSSIWLFYTTEAIPSPRKLRRGVNGQYHEQQGTTSPSIAVHATVGKGEQKTREQYLKEIVHVVEVIESAFFCVPPTTEEMRLYENIDLHLYVYFRGLRHFQKKKKKQVLGEGDTSGGTGDLAALARTVLKATSSRMHDSNI